MAIKKRAHITGSTVKVAGKSGLMQYQAVGPETQVVNNPASPSMGPPVRVVVVSQATPKRLSSRDHSTNFRIRLNKDERVSPCAYLDRLVLIHVDKVDTK